MQIVIDIPEVYYEALRETSVMTSGQRSDKTLMSVIYDAVGNGTPLPKEHGDLIDRNKIKCMKAIHDLHWGKITPFECAKKIRHSAPTIIKSRQYRKRGCKMSNVEHYFENLLYLGKDVGEDVNKNQLSKEQQEAVEECAIYVLCNIFAGRDDFRAYMRKSEGEE